MSQTVSRAIEIVEFCSIQPREVREIAEMLQVHRSTALRLVHTLAAGGFVRKDQRGRYGVGFRLAGLAQAALDQFDLRSVVHPHIADLSQRVGQTVQFAVPQGSHIIYVDKIEPANSIVLNTKIGGFVVVNTAGVSKAILANLPADQRNAIMANATYEKYTPTTLTSPAALAERLEQTRQQGWAEDDGEYDTSSNCIAAPVWDHASNVAGAISITSFRERLDLTDLRKLLPELLETTAAISSELGWRAEPGQTGAVDEGSTTASSHS